MATQSPDQIAANWAAKLAGSTQRITDGVQAVTVSPGVAAARQADVWAQNVAAAKDKWRTNVGSMSNEDWKTAMISKGVPRIASGATASQAKFASFIGRLLPHIDRVKGSLPPRGNLDQNIARSAAFARGMANFKNNG